MAFGSSVLTHKKEQQIKIAGEFKPTVDCLCATRRGFVAVYSRPKYNSAVSTFCWAVANDEPFTVNDRSTELELLYIDDLVEGMFDLLEGKEQHCEFDGVETILKEDGRYCCVPVTHKVTLGEIVDLLQEFKEQPTTLMMPKMPDGSFAKKLYSLYLTYLPMDKFKYLFLQGCQGWPRLRQRKFLEHR